MRYTAKTLMRIPAAKYTLGLAAISLLAVPLLAGAQGTTVTVFENPIKPIGDDPDTAATLILQNIINFLLGIVALHAFIALIFGGIMYIVSYGDEQRVSRAKNIIIFAIAGLLVVAAAALLVVNIGRIFGVA